MSKKQDEEDDDGERERSSPYEKGYHCQKKDLKIRCHQKGPQGEEKMTVFDVGGGDGGGETEGGVLP